MIRRLAFCMLLLSPLAGQQPITMPEFRIPYQDQTQPARLQELSIDVKVVGHVATTTWDMTLYNPQDRVLEGELVFPLGEGQTVSRFAMDVNGHLREAVVVDKAKGRQVFETIARRNVDPGLLEKTAGNSYRARIYPIPAKGSKRVLLAYEQELADADGRNLLYQLPLAFKDRLARFSLRVTVLDQTLAPRVTTSPLETFAFKAMQRAFVAEEVRTDFAPATALAVAIPRPDTSGQVFVEQRGDQSAFYVMVHPQLPGETKPLPHDLLLLWDGSGSARQRDLKAELDLLEAYLRRIGSCQVRLVVFRNEAEPVRSFPIRAGDSRALRQVLEALPLDGATQLGALDLAKLHCDEILLFSDGVNSFGAASPHLPKAPLVAVNSALAAEHGLLRGLSEKLGGEYLNLRSMAPAEALKALTSQPLCFLRASYDPAQLSEVYPSAARVVRGPFGLAGLLRSRKATVTLHFGFRGVERFSRTLSIDATQAAVTAPVTRLWAQRKLAELELDPQANRAAITALGQAQGLVTDGTSLIVLDDLADYLRYRIPPPAELRAQYDQQLAQERKASDDRGQQHLTALAQLFKQRQAWWRTEFKAPALPNPKLKAKRGEAPGPLPPPPPPILQEENSVPEIAPRELPREDRSRRPEASAAVEVVADASEPSAGASGTITLAPWDPATPYLARLKAAPASERYPLYLTLRDTYGDTPGFYLDVADLFRTQGESALALRILSNLAELKLESAPLLRVLGYRLRQLGYHPLAVSTLEQVLHIREEEPQSLRDLALACADAGQSQRAADLLWELVRKPWDGRFRDINLIALGELNALLATAKPAVTVTGLDPRLKENLPVDVRVVLNWDTDNSDMDLHVIDPRGEECFYSHPDSAIGGHVSADVTQGYGPEEFLLKRAIPGYYRIKANFFGTRQQTAIGATTVVLELYLRYGSGRVENKSVTLRLDGRGRMVDIGGFQIGN